MAWIPKDRAQFDSKVSGLWAAWFEKNAQVLEVFAERLREFPIAVVCSALEEIRARSQRFPDLAEIQAEVRRLRNEKARKAAERTEDEAEVDALRRVAEKRGRWRSPRGVECEVTAHGLMFLSGRDPERRLRRFVPWSSLRSAELKQVAAEARYDQPDAEGRLREVTFAEFAESPAFEECIAAARARGEPTSFLQRLRVKARMRAVRTGQEVVREVGQEG